ncbi:CoA transferase [Pigmentiphaga soli]|uniref:CoA transferase n=1 Tax=Pigmentiphaga soli TaxID=1007095 RepID=A0ABP8GFB4_9BURK
MAIARKDFDPSLQGPLRGIRVLDFSRLVAGNMLSLQLADHGAEVVKVEQPGRGDTLRDWKENGHSVYWKVYGRNKKSISLDLKSPQAPGIIRDLVGGFDVVIESFRHRAMEQMGIGPDRLLAANPDLIVVRVSGFGQTGPYAPRPGFGTLVEAMSTFADRNGFADREPVLPPLALADMMAGLYGAMATMVALREIEHNGGKGQVIDLSLFESIFTVLGPEAGIFNVTGKKRQRVGSASEQSAPRNVYATSDGGWVAISASTQRMTERLFAAIGRADLNEHPDFKTPAQRVAHRGEVDAIVGGWIGQRTLSENIAFFEKVGVTAAPVYNIEQLLADPHVQAREMVVEMPDDELGTILMNGPAPKLSGTPAGLRTPAPAIGQHNDEIYGRFYPQDRIAALKAEGVI